jgi:hypothetical protein
MVGAKALAAANAGSSWSAGRMRLDRTMDRLSSARAWAAVVAAERRLPRFLIQSEAPLSATEGRSRLQSGLRQASGDPVYEFTP